MTELPLADDLPTHVVYHDNCFDGFTAAWAVWHHNRGRESDGICYIPGQYGNPMPDLPEFADVLMVDVSWPREELLELENRIASLQVLDHHKTAEDALEGLPFAYFDLERSGAGLAWDYLAGIRGHDGRCKLVNHVEDRDLWRFHLPGTKAVHAYLSSYAFDFEDWNGTHNLLNLDPQRVYREGYAIERYRDICHEKAYDLAHWVQLPHIPEGKGYSAKLPGINIGLHSFISQSLHLLVERVSSAGVAVKYSRGPDGRWYYSLRSKAPIDCSEIAKLYGGGGHPQAAGFVYHEPPRFLEELEFEE